MSWSTFLSLFLFFISNEETYSLLKVNKGFIARVYKTLQFSVNITMNRYVHPTMDLKKKTCNV